jgi:hypothetical protein
LVLISEIGFETAKVTGILPVSRKVDIPRSSIGAGQRIDPVAVHLDGVVMEPSLAGMEFRDDESSLARLDLPCTRCWVSRSSDRQDVARSLETSATLRWARQQDGLDRIALIGSPRNRH